MRRLLTILAIFAVLSGGLFGAGRAQTVELNPQDRPTLPSDPQGAITRARDRVAAGDLNGAIKGLSTYVAGHPGEIAPERLLGDLYYRRGDLHRAEWTYA